MSVYELARKYYPRLWDDARIDALVRAGRLTNEEREQLRREAQAPAAADCGLSFLSDVKSC